MRTTIWKSAVGAGLCGMLAVGAAAGFGQVRTGTDPPSQVTQFCVPGHGDDPDAHRLYCRNEANWSGPAGAAAFAYFMQGRLRVGKESTQPDLQLHAH